MPTKCVNGKYIKMTEEEVAEMEELRKQEEEIAKTKPPTTEEILDIIMGVTE